MATTEKVDKSYGHKVPENLNMVSPPIYPVIGLT